MSLTKKIILGFSISAFIITILAGFEYFNFIQVRNEMRFLEVTATLRNQSLQLRRHEKNFFLLAEKAPEEAAATHDYVNQLNETIGALQSGDPEKISLLKDLVSQYDQRFSNIERLLPGVTQEFDNQKAAFAPYESFVPLMQADVRDKPLYVAGYLQNQFGFPATDPQVIGLKELDADIVSLRETGELILQTATDLDADARDGAEGGIRLSQIAILVFFPFFLLFGLSAMIYVSTDVVRRLKTLTGAIDRIGARYAHGDPAPRKEASHKDEVDVLIEKFNNMNVQLITWEDELDEKNRELLQSKKLAAIGTLAAGVAHELNNPLNNINVSAQVLKKKVAPGDSPETTEIINDIVGQTARVQGIVGNMLEFAREREPRLEELELTGLLRHVWTLVGSTSDVTGIGFVVDADDAGVQLQADPAQLEQVFVNLFTNAVAAMAGAGELRVRVEPEPETIRIFVSDTGVGISPDDRDKVFDPFFTRKDKGTGLGLAIVMNIIRKHGGDILLVSEEDMGTVFEITLPRGQAR
ncbi:MAG: sensor histidine kinase [Thermoleophilia bacterium]